MTWTRFSARTTSAWAKLTLIVLEALQRALDRAENAVREHSGR